MSSRYITLEIDERIYLKLREDAKERQMTAARFAQVLFDAAYSARHGNTGDRTLEAKVSAAIILRANGMDAEKIARAIDCPEGTAKRIITAWRRELA